MNKIKELRTNKNLNQEDLAQILNLKRQTISAWETNKTNPKHIKLIKLARYFGVSTDYLLGLKEQEV